MTQICAIMVQTCSIMTQICVIMEQHMAHFIPDDVSFYHNLWHFFTQPLAFFHTTVGIFYPKHWNVFKHLKPHTSTNCYSIHHNSKRTQSCSYLHYPLNNPTQLITPNSNPLFQQCYPATSRLLQK